MKLLLAVLLCITFGQAQEPAAVIHDQHDLSVKEIIEIVAEFDIKHEPQQPFFIPAFGVTNFDSTPPAIWIFNTGDMTTRRSTLIHELLHVHCHNLGIDCPEEYVRSEEDRQFQKLFGIQ